MDVLFFYKIAWLFFGIKVASDFLNQYERQMYFYRELRQVYEWRRSRRKSFEMIHGLGRLTYIPGRRLMSEAAFHSPEYQALLRAEMGAFMAMIILCSEEDTEENGLKLLALNECVDETVIH